MATVVLMLPALIFGTGATHSAASNLTWAAQFAEQVHAGALYPRWMPNSFSGLGSPVFYFYPPLPFWWDAAVSLITFGGLPVTYRLSVTMALVLWVSALGGHAWLKSIGCTPTRCLWGALFYIAAPYHLLDFTMRGAAAELTAYAILPFVLLSMRRIGDARPYATALLSLSYAGLVLAHLPSAMLVSVTALPAYGLSLWRHLPAMALSSLLGIGLTGIYLIPALTLQDSISAEYWWSPFFGVENWFLTTPDRWPAPSIMKLIVPIAGAYCLLAFAVVVQMRRLTLWSGVGLASLLLMTGLVPWFWQLPEISKVQFPWRLLLVVEFCLVTACCTVSLPIRKTALALALPAALLLLVINLMIARDGLSRWRYAFANGLVLQDVSEYLPRGFPPFPGDMVEDDWLARSVEGPLVSCKPAGTVCRGTADQHGGVHLEIQADTPTAVTVRRFFFPSWSLGIPLPLFASDPHRLVSFIAPAGKSSLHLRIALADAEAWGLAVSGASLLLIILWAVRPMR
jgi:hypothetical protein